MLVLAIILGALLAPAPLVSALDWCGSLTVSRTPQSGFQGGVVSIAITLTNELNQDLDIPQITVNFGWSPTVWDWGSIGLLAFSSDTNTRSITLPSTPGNYSVHTTVTGQILGDFVPENCGPFTGTFRVLTVPPSPTVIVTANPTTGFVPLTVSFSATPSDGLSPFTYSWTFGDGGTGAGSSTSHAYSSPGSYDVQVIVTDARGRSASDSVTIDVAGGFIGPGGLLLPLIVVIAGGAAAIWLRRRRAPPPSQPPPKDSRVRSPSAQSRLSRGSLRIPSVRSKVARE